MCIYHLQQRIIPNIIGTLKRTVGGRNNSTVTSRTRMHTYVILYYIRRRLLSGLGGLHIIIQINGRPGPTICETDTSFWGIGLICSSAVAAGLYEIK